MTESQANTIMEIVAHHEAKFMRIGSTVSTLDTDFLAYVYENWKHAEEGVYSRLDIPDDETWHKLWDMQTYNQETE